MASNKKTHEELVKQINVKTEFADKLYKKMRADRYGMTFCCPLELEAINLTNDICNWQDLKVTKLSEEYEKNLIVDPVELGCKPPAVYNPVSGLCEGTTTAEQVGTDTYTYSAALPNGLSQIASPVNHFTYGKDCPIIMDSYQINGAGSNPAYVGCSVLDGTTCSPSWWVTYNATPSGPASQQITGVTETSFVNSLAIGANLSSGWQQGALKYFSIPIQTNVTKTYYIFIAADGAFGIKLNGTYLIQAVAPINTNQGVWGTSIYAANMGMDGLVNNVVVADGSTNFPPDPTKFRPQCNEQIMAQGLLNVASTRGFLYPVELTAGCNVLEFEGYRLGGLYPTTTNTGMLAFSIFNNTRNEIIASTGRTDLTEIASSDGINQLYQQISPSIPWTCNAPDVLQAASGNACPMCQTTVTTLSYRCPDGYIEVAGNPPTCIISAEPPCNTETLNFSVVNQNGEVMPDYDITFNGGTYTTNDLGLITIVIQNASINNVHTLDLCHCITTSGGCAVQTIKITATDPDAVICTTPDPTCNCNAPSFSKESVVVPAVSTDPYIVTIGFTDVYWINGETSTSVTYTVNWKLSTATVWNEIAGLTATSGIVTTTISGLENEILHYRIKSACASEDSEWSATNSVTLTA